MNNLFPNSPFISLNIPKFTVRIIQGKMAGNTFGKAFRLTTFGESHGIAIGGIIDGCPAGIDIDEENIQSMLDKRRPGQSAIVSQRKEDDRVEFLSGIFEGKTLGTPIGFIIKNKDAKPADYDHLKSAYRPSHADYTWEAKYGIRDHRGGGRASARETACRVVGGAIAEELLKSYNISIHSWVSSVGELSIPDNKILDMGAIYSNEVRCPHTETANKMIELIKEVRSEGDSLGGIITCSITGVPPGLGEPVFDKLHADLGKAMLSINAVKGFEIGSGFEGSRWRGSRHNDPFTVEKGKIRTISNFSGGIQGGISNGEEIIFRTAFKPTATIIQKQETISTSGEPVTLEGKGRHDPCVVPRAVPIVQSMAALVITDHLLRNRLSKF